MAPFFLHIFEIIVYFQMWAMIVLEYLISQKIFMSSNWRFYLQGELLSLSLHLATTRLSANEQDRIEIIGDGWKKGGRNAPFLKFSLLGVQLITPRLPFASLVSQGPKIVGGEGDKYQHLLYFAKYANNQYLDNFCCKSPSKIFKP